MKNLLLGLLLALAATFAFAQSNTSGTALASAAQTATVSSADLTNTNWRGVHVIINVSAYTSGNFTPTIQGKDPISGTYYSILVGTAISSTGITVLKVYPGLATSANAAASDILPRTWRVTMTGAASPSATFSVSYFYDL